MIYVKLTLPLSILYFFAYIYGDYTGKRSHVVIFHGSIETHTLLTHGDITNMCLLPTGDLCPCQWLYIRSDFYTAPETSVICEATIVLVNTVLQALPGTNWFRVTPGFFFLTLKGGINYI